MPRWKALPEELDPEVREFAGQLRRLVERSGLSVAAVADRTGFSKTSWERYLNARLLAPQRAVIALAEVTGANSGHLTTLWELAERAWSRSEMRHDHTMEAIRVAQARAALGELDTAPADAARAAAARKQTAKAAVTTPRSAATTAKTAKAPKMSKAPQAPQMPQQRSGELPSEVDFSEMLLPAAPASPPTVVIPDVADHIPSPASPLAPAPPAEGSYGEDRPARGRRAVMFAVGAVGALLVALAAVLLIHPADGGSAKAASKPSAPPSKKPVLPAGVGCSGADCAGKDPEKMGCSGQYAVSPSRGTAGTVLIEVRYSKVCHAAWARITGATQGDQATVSAGDRSATARAGRDGDAYTPMVAVPGDPAKVAACGTTVAGTKACARPVPAAP
ncbi:helix-turn-helix domain-containing protein [Streptomyces sp. NPDC093589]|uniref:helix-turn-helix domain-containing protein n=1 Tax=Streptomyces sp. NPDC093589 TaxID=3366043 RepID=UPI00380D7918